MSNKDKAEQQAAEGARMIIAASELISEPLSFISQSLVNELNSDDAQRAEKLGVDIINTAIGDTALPDHVVYTAIFTAFRALNINFQEVTKPNVSADDKEQKPTKH